MLLLTALALVITAAPAAAAAPQHVSGWALVGPTARISGGTVDVRSLAGRDLVVPADRTLRTTSTGTFAVRVSTLPRRYVVTVTGGRVNGKRMRGTFRAIVTRGAHGRLIHVTPVSTLVRARYRHHGSVLRAEGEVRRLLDFPGALALDDVRRDRRAFDGERFDAVAARRGGFDAYVVTLTKRAAGTQHRFRGRPLARTSQAGDPLTPTGVLAGLAQGALRAVGSQGMNEVLSALGFGGGDAAQLDEISAQLTAIKAELDELSTQVAALSQQVTALQAQVAQSSYSTLDSNLGVTWIGGPADDVLTDIAWLVDNAAGCTGALSTCVSSIPANTDPRAWCTSSTQAKTPAQANACDAISRITTLTQGNDWNALQGRLVGNGSADGVFQAYQKAAYQQIKAAGGFITPSYGAKAATLGNHYAWILTLGAQYSAMLDATEGRSGTLTAGDLNLAISDIAAQQALLPKPLGNTAVDTRTGLMWSVSQNASASTACGPVHSPWLFNHPQSAPATAGQCSGLLASSIDPDVAALDGWQMPTIDELKALASGWSGDSVGDWLQSTAGFPDLTSVKSAVAVPGPDPFVIGIYGGNVEANPGTNYSVASSSCGAGTWNTGMVVPAGYMNFDVIRISGVFCSVLDLNTGANRQECVAADASAAGCAWPILVSRGDGPLDFGHPNVSFMRRPATAADGWFRTP
ncbi:MAG: FlxA-like family protein [Solirubrobacteraceae bacterium]|nr:FlxA-like family protein [Solirubrobacteraceae bacterium]